MNRQHAFGLVVFSSSWLVACVSSSTSAAVVDAATDVGAIEAGPADASDVSDDARAPDAADAASTVDADAVVVDGGLASCCEIFPSFAPADSGADADVFSPNPLAADFGTVSVGAEVALSLRYYNACGAPGLTLTGVKLEAEAGASDFVLDPGSSVGTPIQGTSQAEVHVRFHPSAAGPHAASVIVETNKGYYLTRLSGLGAL